MDNSWFIKLARVEGKNYDVRPKTWRKLKFLPHLLEKTKKNTKLFFRNFPEIRQNFPRFCKILIKLFPDLSKWDLYKRKQKSMVLFFALNNETKWLETETKPRRKLNCIGNRNGNNPKLWETLRKFLVNFEESVRKFWENFALISRKFWEIFAEFMWIIEKVLRKFRENLAEISGNSSGNYKGCSANNASSLIARFDIMCIFSSRDPWSESKLLLEVHYNISHVHLCM